MATLPRRHAKGRARQALFRPAMESLEERSMLAGSPLITELMADNRSTLFNAFLNDHPDWIEIYNPGPGSLDLTGWFLTDRKNELHLWQFPPSVVVGDDDYLIVFASGLGPEVEVPAGELHTNFRLGRSGEYLALVRPDGTTVVAEYEPAFPVQSADVSYGLTAELDDTAYFTTPTPGQMNPPVFRASVFSHEAGFYVEPQQILLDTAILGSTIHYTTDGSVPTEADLRYTAEGIRIDATTPLRVKGMGADADGALHTRTFFYVDQIVSQPAAPAGWPDNWVAADGGRAVADYGFDPEIVQDARYVGELSEDLWALPSLSLVMDPDDLLQPDTGIYSNPMATGQPWERSVSLELIDPAQGEHLQVDAGLRLSGGTSRDPDQTPKHSFRVYFKNEYGPTWLDATLYPGSGPQRFDRLELLAGLQDGWLQPDPQLRQEAVLIRDAWVHETMAEMGQPAARGRFVHLYLNGLYWGVYNLAERIDEAFGAIHFGGSKSEYDVIDTGQLESGQAEGFRALLDLAAAGLQSEVAYEQVQQYLDVDNFVDFVLVRMFVGDRQWSDGNWFALRNRVREEPFRFFLWDSENALRKTDAEILPLDPNGIDPVVQLFSALRENKAFRRTFADRVQRHLFAGGALTPEQTSARWNQHGAALSSAIVAESARWGDYRRDAQPPADGPHELYTRDDHWQIEFDRLLNDFFPQRTDRVLDQLRESGLFPTVDAPAFSQSGGVLLPGSSLTMTVSHGEIYYTTGGSDPAQISGHIHPDALRYQRPVLLEDDMVVKARTWSGGQWSALVEATFYEPTALTVSELQYHALPADDPAGPFSNDDFDFVELLNSGDEVVDLIGISFTEGITFDFAAGAVTRLDPGQRTVVVRNQQAFASRYETAGMLIAGEFSGRLSNAGERIVLTGALGQTLAELTYVDDWFEITDGEGFSLVRRHEVADPTSLDQLSDWRPSHYIGGSPGDTDSGFNPDSIIISEALTHSDPPESDWLELHNTTASDIDLGGWYISSIRDDPREYEIPAGTVLPADGYLVFTADEPNFVVGFGGVMGFNISKLGETISLTSPGLEGDLGGYRLEVEFTYGFNSTAFIRHVNSAGLTQYLPALENTPGWPNSRPTVDRIWDHGYLSLEAVISEVMYYPAGHGDEYIELYNPHPETVYLDQPFPPSWRFTEGVHFNFPDGATLPPRSYALVVPIDPAEFRTKYDVPLETSVFGPYLGELTNTGELLQLSRAVEADAFVPYSMTDQVFYNHQSAEWPAAAQGRGASLNRQSYRAFGNDVTNWAAGVIGGTPGRPNLVDDSSSHIVDRFVFYNDSSFDTDDPAANANDDRAIAVDKLPLLPGESASFANYTSYSRGLNGIMIDVHALPGTLELADFEFRAGNDSDPTSWDLAPAPISVSTRPDAGVGGSDRVTLVWQNSAIVNQWLQVTVRATPNTGLAAEDVFYFGNAIAETGDSSTDARVDGTDFGRARDFYNNREFLAITDVFDFDRDGAVDSSDLSTVFYHGMRCANGLNLIDLRDPTDTGQIVQRSPHRTSAGLEITLPDALLIPDQPGQIITVDAHGDASVTGMNLQIELDAGVLPRDVPRLSGLELHGQIWDAAAITTWQCLTVQPISSVRASVVILDPLNTLTADGSVASLRVDTTGVTAGRYELRLTRAGVDSDFLGTPAYLRDGSISIAAPGDANLDGRFDSHDLVQVFQAGQYEDGVQQNSGWHEGDWNRDGEFSTSDMVLAFQQGSYEFAAAAQKSLIPSGSRPLAAAVTRPGSPVHRARPASWRRHGNCESQQCAADVLLEMRARDSLFERLRDLPVSWSERPAPDEVVDDLSRGLSVDGVPAPLQ